MSETIDVSPEQSAQGPDGECCEKCRYFYTFKTGVNVCRLFPPHEVTVMIPPTVLSKNQKPQQGIAVVHTQTLPYDWCSHFTSYAKSN